MALTTIERPEQEVATTVATSTPSGASRRRPTLVATIAALVVAGGLAGFAATRDSGASDTSRGRAADSARLQAVADAYLAHPSDLDRGRAADAARLQAQADAYLGG